MLYAYHVGSGLVCGENFVLTDAQKVSAKPIVKHEYNLRKRKEIKYTK